MATYDHTLTLTKATPTVRESDGFVTQWDIAVEYAHAGEGDNPAWASTYTHSWEIVEPSKMPAGYTKAQLVSEMPSIISDSIFDTHYEAFNNVSVDTESSVDDFSLDDLASD